MKILIVDDHEIVRQGLRTLLSRKSNFQIVGEAGSVAQAIEEAKATSPEVVLMDLRLPDGSGVEACREIRSFNPDTKVIMLTSYTDDKAVLDSIMAGASAYLLKQIDSKALFSALEHVYQGESILDSAVTKRVLEKVKHVMSQHSSSSGSVVSARQEQILALIAEGKTNREIAMDLYLSEKTVKNYVSAILEKLNMSRRTEAAAYYVRRQISEGL